LSKLGGALCTFALDSHPRELPLYDHMNLEECSAAWTSTFAAIWNRGSDERDFDCAPATQDYYWEGDVTDQRCLDRARWMLAVRAPLGEVEIMSRTPALVKSVRNCLCRSWWSVRCRG